MKLKIILAGIAVSVAASVANAHSFKFGNIDIGHPYARSTAPGQPNGGAYLSLYNKGGDDKLLSATAAVSNSVELHLMSMDGNVMRMRQVDGVALPAGKMVELKPGALHVMLLGLKAPLKEGDKFPMKLTFEKAGEVEVTVNVEGPAANHEHENHDHMK
jgi:copper(I)-binding protein